MFFSIIIPVYNVERWLAACLDSVLSQDFTDYEIIIIDDCSPDKSYEIYEAYAKQHSCITVLKHSVNKRQGAAKNYGMRVAKGEWIVFLDSDDLMAQGALRFYYEKALKTKDSYFVCIFDRIDESDCVSSIGKFDEVFSTLYDNNTKVKLSDHKIISLPFLCTKCYRKAFLLENNIFFNENVLFEDLIFNFKLLLNQPKFVCYNKIVYHYRVNSESSTYGTISIEERQARKTSEKYRNIRRQSLSDWLSEYNQMHILVLKSTLYSYYAPLVVIKMLHVILQDFEDISPKAISYLIQSIARQNQYDKQIGNCRILAIFNCVPRYLLPICLRFLSKLWILYKKLFRKGI